MTVHELLAKYITEDKTAWLVKVISGGGQVDAPNCWRAGQMAFNAVHAIYGPYVARSVSPDPFHNDSLTADFLKAVVAKLESIEWHDDPDGNVWFAGGDLEYVFPRNLKPYWI
jgi:hypothetical protein